MMTPIPRGPYAVCPHCHTSVPGASFEHATCGPATYLVCPECDHTVVVRLPLPDWLAVPQSGKVSAVVQTDGERHACSTSE